MGQESGSVPDRGEDGVRLQRRRVRTHRGEHRRGREEDKRAQAKDARKK